MEHNGTNFTINTITTTTASTTGWFVINGASSGWTIDPIEEMKEKFFLLAEKFFKEKFKFNQTSATYLIKYKNRKDARLVRLLYE